MQTLYNGTSFLMPVDSVSGHMICLLSFLFSILYSSKVVSSNPVHGELCSIQPYVTTFVSDVRQVGGFLRILRFPPQIKLTTTI